MNGVPLSLSVCVCVCCCCVCEQIDLDTIETSNLNRQFLFRKRHVGESKAKVACATALEMVRAAEERQTRGHGASQDEEDGGAVNGEKKKSRDVTIVPHHANIKDAAYDVTYFKQFDIVLNGLDNLEARRHVNRMCIAAGVPLVESGTAGYLGQVTVHIDQQTSCFDCHPRPATTKQYPICTIRNTPDKPIHCIVWAKDILFKRLLGPKDAITDLDDGMKRQAGADGDDEERDAMTANGVSENAQAGASDSGGDTGADPGVSFFVRRDDESAREYAKRVFARVFSADIERLLEVKEMWENRAQPTSLTLDSIVIPEVDAAVSSTSASARLGLANSQEVWDLAQNAVIFLESIVMFLETRADEVGSIEFDKDDDLAVELVTSAANLRMTNYGIKTQSLFEVKGMAGNIIHAIATTNAIVAGLIVLEAKKILTGALNECRSTYLLMSPSNKKLLMAVTPDEPNPTCCVCKATKARLVLEVDTGTATLASLINQILVVAIGMEEPAIYLGDNLVYDADEDQEFLATFEAQMDTTLASLNTPIVHGSILEIEDVGLAFEAQVLIHHRDGAGYKFVIQGEYKEYFGKANLDSVDAGDSADGNAGTGAEDDDDDIVVVTTDAEEAARGQKKTKRPLDTNGTAAQDNDVINDAHMAKKTKVSTCDEDDVIIL